MPSARYDLSIGAARAGTLFASPLQRSDEPAVRSASLKPSGTRSPSSQQPDPTVKVASDASAVTQHCPQTRPSQAAIREVSLDFAGAGQGSGRPTPGIDLPSWEASRLQAVRLSRGMWAGMAQNRLILSRDGG